MAFAFFFLLTAAAAAAAAIPHTASPAPRPVVKVVEHYVVADNGWLKFRLKYDTASVTRIEWCKSLGRTLFSIGDCSLPGLMHLVLYPSNGPPAIRMPQKEEPGVVYLDPTAIGGPDATHSFAIKIFASLNATTDLVQMFEFNAEPAIKMEPPTATPIFSSSSSLSETVPAVETSAAAVGVASTRNPFWREVLVFWVAGVAIVCLSVFFLIKRSKLPSRALRLLTKSGERDDDDGAVEDDDVPTDCERLDDLLDHTNTVQQAEKRGTSVLESMGVTPAFHQNK